MATSKPVREIQMQVRKALEDADNVTVSLAMSRIQFEALVSMRKRKGMLSDQELIRLFIARGLEENA